MASQYYFSLRSGGTEASTLDIVILLSLSILPHLRIHHTEFIGYSDTYNDCSDNLAVISMPPALSLYKI